MSVMTMLSRMVLWVARRSHHEVTLGEDGLKIIVSNGNSTRCWRQWVKLVAANQHVVARNIAASGRTVRKQYCWQEFSAYVGENAGDQPRASPVPPRIVFAPRRPAVVSLIGLAGRWKLCYPDLWVTH